MGKLKSLLKYTKKYKKRYFVGILFLLLVDIVQLIPPKILGGLTDSLSQGNANINTIIKAICHMMIIAVIMSVGRFMWRIYINGTSRMIEYDIRSKNLLKVSVDA